jgi:hypothetical protein
VFGGAALQRPAWLHRTGIEPVAPRGRGDDDPLQDRRDDGMPLPEGEIGPPLAKDAALADVAGKRPDPGACGDPALSRRDLRLDRLRRRAEAAMGSRWHRRRGQDPRGEAGAHPARLGRRRPRPAPSAPRRTWQVRLSRAAGWASAIKLRSKGTGWRRAPRRRTGQSGMVRTGMRRLRGFA